MEPGICDLKPGVDDTRRRRGGGRQRQLGAGQQRRVDVGRVVEQAFDLCVLDVGSERAALDGVLETLSVDREPVQVGQEVVFAGHNRCTVNDVGVETCTVVEPTTDVADPDTVQPSPLVVPSFAIDCRDPEHGASGSPVFDANTGALLGILWTGGLDSPQRAVELATSAAP